MVPVSAWSRDSVLPWPSTRILPRLVLSTPRVADCRLRSWAVARGRRAVPVAATAAGESQGREGNHRGACQQREGCWEIMVLLCSTGSSPCKRSSAPPQLSSGRRTATLTSHRWGSHNAHVRATCGGSSDCARIQTTDFRRRGGILDRWQRRDAAKWRASSGVALDPSQHRVGISMRGAEREADEFEVAGRGGRDSCTVVARCPL